MLFDQMINALSFSKDSKPVFAGEKKTRWRLQSDQWHANKASQRLNDQA